MTTARRSALPGFGPAMAITLCWVSLIVLVPLASLALRPWELGLAGVWHSVTEPRVLAALKLSFGAAALAASVNVPFGLLVAWVMVRYRFPGRRLADSLIDMPLALPTAVAGIALTALFSPKGWIGAWLTPLGIKVAYTPLGIMVALVFVGLPFVVRTLEPVLMDLPLDAEEAAATLGATRAQTLRRVVLPALAPALLAGFAAALARGVGEYGSVIFIAGNMPMISEIAPLLIVIRLEQLDYAGAAALGLIMLLVSFAILLLLNLLQKRMGVTDAMSQSQAVPSVLPAATRERPGTRVVLTGFTIVLLVILLLLPLAVVFTEALSHGLGAVGVALTDPDSLASIQLTLLVAAVSVPLNTVCGLAAAWCIGRFQFRGRSLLLTLIELPLSVSPVISGLVWVLLFGANGWFGPLLDRAGVRIIFAVPGLILATAPGDLPVRRPDADPPDAAARRRRRGGRHHPRRRLLADVLARHTAQCAVGLALRCPVGQRPRHG